MLVFCFGKRNKRVLEPREGLQAPKNQHALGRRENAVYGSPDRTQNLSSHIHSPRLTQCCDNVSPIHY